MCSQPYPNTAVAFLAGGLSSRMGTPKALLTLQGETFLERQVRIFTGFGERLLSVNDDRIAQPGLLRVGDIRPGLGPMGGLYSVLAVCQSQRVLFVPCDMPLLTLEAADRLLKGLGDGDACVARVEGQLEPLGAVYAKSALPVMERCIQSGNLRLKDMLAQLDCRIVSMETAAERRAFTNINTADQLAFLHQNCAE